MVAQLEAGKFWATCLRAVLAPLVVLGTRGWCKSYFNERQRRIDEVRPTHADGDPDAAVVAVEAVDLEHVMVRDDPHTFDDLIDPDPVPSQADEPVDAPDVGAEEAVAEEAAADDVVAPDVVAPDVVAEEAGAEDVVAEEVGDEDAVADEPASDEPVLQPVAEVEAEPVPEPVTVADVEPEPAPVPVPPVVRSIVIDTAPKPRDTPADLGPEPADSDPTPVPIDPLLRMQSE